MSDEMIPLEEAEWIVMSCNETLACIKINMSGAHSSDDPVGAMEGIAEQMREFREENEAHGTVNLTMFASEDEADELIAQINKNFD